MKTEERLWRKKGKLRKSHNPKTPSPPSSCTQQNPTKSPLFTTKTTSSDPLIRLKRPSSLPVPEYNSIIQFWDSIGSSGDRCRISILEQAPPCTLLARPGKIRTRYSVLPTSSKIFTGCRRGSNPRRCFGRFSPVKKAFTPLTSSFKSITEFWSCLTKNTVPGHKETIPIFTSFSDYFMASKVDCWRDIEFSSKSFLKNKKDVNENIFKTKEINFTNDQGYDRFMFGSVRRKSIGYAQQLEIEERSPFKVVIAANNCRYFGGVLSQEDSEDTITKISSSKVGFVVSTCATLCRIKDGKQIHKRIMKFDNYRDDVVLCNALVEKYAKCGRIIEARFVFDRMPFNNLMFEALMVKGNATTTSVKKCGSVEDGNHVFRNISCYTGQ